MQTLSGVVSFENNEKIKGGNVVVCLYDSTQCTKFQFYDAILRNMFSQSCLLKVTDGSPAKFSFEVDPKHTYFIFAFATALEKYDSKYALPEVGKAMGWYREKPGKWFCEIFPDKVSSSLAIELRAARSTGFSERISSNKHAKLVKVENLWTLRLTGSPKEFSFGHGEICAQEILDFFEFFALEGFLLLRLPTYETCHDFLVKNLKKYPEYDVELEAMFEGMKSSGTSLYLPMIGREFTLNDLHVLQALFDTRVMVPIHCTQFAAWGSETTGTDVAGGILAGRNMDAEIDVRRITVTHFLIVCKERFTREKTPTSCDDHVVHGTSRRVISAFWPGFVGTLTGINEDGVYCSENAGNQSPGDPVSGITTGQWAMQEFLAWNSNENLSVEKSIRFFEKYNSAGGGMNCLGALFLTIWPTIDGNLNNTKAFIFESDRYGQASRIPGEFRPTSNHLIMASNHFLKYGVTKPPLAADPSEFQIFSQPCAFNSAYRYKAGMELIEGWSRAGTKISTKEMITLLQSACSGYTEHSVIMRITKSQGLEVGVALADASEPTLWDAPHKTWTFVPFKKFFD